MKLTDEQIYVLSDFYKVFGDSTRIKILIELINGEKTVTEIVDNLEMSQSAVSHQLQVLRKNRIVKTERKGKYIIYSLDDSHIESTLSQGIAHIMHG